MEDMVIIPRHNLELLSMHELSVVMDAITLGRDALRGVQNQPRCYGGAFTEISELTKAMDGLVDEIVEVADRAKPETVAEATIRAYIIIHYETTYPDRFSEVVASAQSLQRDIAALQAPKGGEA